MQSLNQFLAVRARRRATALHEAGHVIVGHYLGAAVEEAHLSPAYVNLDRHALGLCDQLACLLAGELAARVWFGRELPPTPEDYPLLFLDSPSDWDQIQKLVTGLELDAKNAALAEAYGHAEMLVEELRDPIFDVANRLEARSDLIGDELEQILAILPKRRSSAARFLALGSSE